MSLVGLKLEKSVVGVCPVNPFSEFGVVVLSRVPLSFGEA